MIDATNFIPLERKFYTLMLLRRIVFSSLLITGFIVFYFSNKNKEIPGSIFVLGAFLVLVFVLVYIFSAKLFYKKKKYKIENTNLSYRKGVLINQLIVVPFSRIQHIEIDEGPFERFFKLSTMSVYTAGDSGKDLKISGLKTEKAQEIKEIITAYIKDE